MPTRLRVSCTPPIVAVVALLLLFLFPTLPSSVIGASPTGSSITLGSSIRILLSAGVRGRMMPVGKSQADCTMAQVGTSLECYGGISRRAAFIANQKALYPNRTIAVDVGNNYFGSLFSSIDRAATVADWMVLAGYDALGVGTVDFFGGPSLFGDYLRRLGSIPVVSSNLDVTLETSIPAGRLSRWSVLDVGGVEVGIVGCIEATLSASSSAGPRVKVNGNYTCINYLARSISEMRRQHTDLGIIVAMASLNFNSRSLAMEIATTVEHVDIVLTEYQPDDTLVSMQIVENVFGSNVVIASIPYITDPVYILGGSMLALEADFDSNGLLLFSNVSTTLLNRQQPDDPRLWYQPDGPVQQAMDKITALGNEVVGTLKVDLAGWTGGIYGSTTSSCDSNVCNLGLLVTSSMLDWCTDCDVAHLNSGGLRADLTSQQLVSPPSITRRNVLDLLPFGNTLVSYNILARDFLRLVLEYSVKVRGSLAFQQLQGVRVAFNPSMKSIVYVEIYDRRAQVWRPYDPDAVYKVTTILFILNGGDGYNILPYAYNVNLFGVNDAENLVSTFKTSNRTFASVDSLRQCFQQSYDVVDTWNAPLMCTYALSSSIINLASGCPTTNLSSCVPGGEVYPGKYFSSNSSGCFYCSGLGSCAAGGVQTCVCDGPSTTGPFRGIQMIQGKACEQIRTEYPVQTSLRVFCYALSGLTCAVAVCVSIFFFRNRAEKVVKRSSTTFLQLCCLGSIIGGICAMVIALPTTSATCLAADWLGHMGFIVLFGSLFIKTQRIYELFYNTKMQQLSLTDTQMLGRLSVLILFELTLRLIETFVAPLEQTAVEYGSTSGCEMDRRSTIQTEWFYWFQCRSSHTFLFDAIKWGTKGLLTIWGVALAVLVRKIDKNYNESKLLGAIIYNMVIFAGLCKATVAYLDTSAPSVNFSLTVIIINYVLLCTLLGLAVPKWRHLRKLDDELSSGKNGAGGVGAGAGAALTTGRGSTVSRPLSSAQLRRGTTTTPTTGTAVAAFEKDKPISSARDANSGSVSTPAGLHPTHFQTLCTRTQTTLAAMSASDRKAHIASFTQMASQFLSALNSLGDDASSSSTSPSSPSVGPTSPSNPGMLKPMPRPLPKTVNPNRSPTSASSSPSLGPGAPSRRPNAIQRPINGTSILEEHATRSSTTTPRTIASPSLSPAAHHYTIAPAIELQSFDPPPTSPGVDTAREFPTAPNQVEFDLDGEGGVPENEVYDFGSDSDD